MPTLRQIALDDRGLDYVREQLEGVNAFCSELLMVIEQTPGDRKSTRLNSSHSS